MKTYEGNIEITATNAAEWQEKLKGVKKITGDLRVYGTAQLPALTEVGGDLRVYGTAQLPALTEVGGYLLVYGTAQLTAPALTEVGGDLRVYGTTQLPARDKIGNKPKPMRPIREKFAKKGYLLADNILSRIISKRKSKEITIYKTYRIGKRGKVQYVVQKGNIFSHGETIKQASHDLRYKLSDRDTTKYAKWTLATVKPIADIIQAYRAITGACETGTRQWCEGKKFPAKISVRLAIRATRGAYQAGHFSAFFNKKVEVNK